MHSSYFLLISDNPKCKTKNSYPTACLSFQIPDGIVPSDVSKAELWIYKDMSVPRNGNHTVVVTEEFRNLARSPRKTPTVIQEALLTGMKYEYMLLNIIIYRREIKLTHVL